MNRKVVSSTKLFRVGISSVNEIIVNEDTIFVDESYSHASRIGPLRKFIIYDASEHSHWLSMIMKFCELDQLEDIEINFWDGRTKDECSIHNFRKFFRSAKKLVAVTIEGSNIYNAVDCLNVMNPETLEKLFLEDRGYDLVNGKRPSFNLDKFPNLREVQFHQMEICGDKERMGGSLKRLEKLHIYNCNIPENFIHRIATFTNLQELILQGNDCDLKNEHICNIAENCGKLRHIWIVGSRDLTSDCFQYLGKMLSLERLTLHEFQDVDYDNFIYLMNVKRLEFEFDAYTESGDVLIELIADFPNLEKLVLIFVRNVDLDFVNAIRDIFHCGLKKKPLQIIIMISDEESFSHAILVESDHPLLTVSYNPYQLPD